LIYPNCLPKWRDIFITTRNNEEHSMMDVIVLGFALAIGYAHACERL
jgi:hypothetical protein